MRDITPLVNPGSIAVIGASASEAKSGGILFKNLLSGGFDGPLYPINPRAEVVMGRKAYPSIAEVPEPIDLAFIVLPRQHVRDALAQCVAKRVRSACIITAGFSEASAAGREDEEELREMARAGGILLAGPNTIGLVNARSRVMGSFVPFPRWESGGVSIFAQTGIFTGAYILQVMSADSHRLPVGISLDVGNKIDVDELDFLAFVKDDPETKVIGLYLESMREPRRFLDLAAEIAREKPIVVLKPGRTAAGAKASASHTGSLASDDALFDAGLKQFGIVRADDEDDFIGYLGTFARLGKPAGKRVGVLTSSGALGVIATDQLATAGLEMAEFGPDTLSQLETVFPDWQKPANPFDFWVSLDIKGNRLGHEVPLNAILADANTDMVLCVLLAPQNADFPDFREVFASARARYPDKPIVAAVFGGAVRDRWVRELDACGVPVCPNTSSAVRAIRALAFQAGQLR